MSGSTTHKTEKGLSLNPAIHNKRTRRSSGSMLSPMYMKRTLLDIADTDWYLIASRTEKIMSKLNTSTADVGPADTGNLKIQRTKSGVLNLVLKQHQTIQPTPPIEEKDSQIITSKQALQRGRSSGRTSRKKKTKAQLPFLGHNTIEKGVSKAIAANTEKSDGETSKSGTPRV